MLENQLKSDHVQALLHIFSYISPRKWVSSLALNRKDVSDLASSTWSLYPSPMNNSLGRSCTSLLNKGLPRSSPNSAKSYGDLSQSFSFEPTEQKSRASRKRIRAKRLGRSLKGDVVASSINVTPVRRIEDNNNKMKAEMIRKPANTDDFCFLTSTPVRDVEKDEVLNRDEKSDTKKSSLCYENPSGYGSSSSPPPLRKNSGEHESVQSDTLPELIGSDQKHVAEELSNNSEIEKNMSDEPNETDTDKKIDFQKQVLSEIHSMDELADENRNETEPEIFDHLPERYPSADETTKMKTKSDAKERTYDNGKDLPEVEVPSEEITEYWNELETKGKMGDQEENLSGKDICIHEIKNELEKAHALEEIIIPITVTRKDPLEAKEMFRQVKKLSESHLSTHEIFVEQEPKDVMETFDEGKAEFHTADEQTQPEQEEDILKHGEYHTENKIYINNNDYQKRPELNAESINQDEFTQEKEISLDKIIEEMKMKSVWEEELSDREEDLPEKVVSAEDECNLLLPFNVEETKPLATYGNPPNVPAVVLEILQSTIDEDKMQELLPVAKTEQDDAAVNISPFPHGIEPIAGRPECLATNLHESSSEFNMHSLMSTGQSSFTNENLHYDNQSTNETDGNNSFMSIYFKYNYLGLEGDDTNSTSDDRLSTTSSENSETTDGNHGLDGDGDVTGDNNHPSDPEIKDQSQKENYGPSGRSHSVINAELMASDNYTVGNAVTPDISIGEARNTEVLMQLGGAFVSNCIETALNQAANETSDGALEKKSYDSLPERYLQEYDTGFVCAVDGEPTENFDEEFNTESSHSQSIIKSETDLFKEIEIPTIQKAISTCSHSSEQITSNQKPKNQYAFLEKKQESWLPKPADIFPKDMVNSEAMNKAESTPVVLKYEGEKIQIEDNFPWGTDEPEVIVSEMHSPYGIDREEVVATKEIEKFTKFDLFTESDNNIESATPSVPEFENRDDALSCISSDSASSPSLNSTYHKLHGYRSMSIDSNPEKEHEVESVVPVRKLWRQQTVSNEFPAEYEENKGSVSTEAPESLHSSSSDEYNRENKLLKRLLYRSRSLVPEQSDFPEGRQYKSNSIDVDSPLLQKKRSLWKDKRRKFGISFKPPPDSDAFIDTSTPGQLT